MKILAVDDDSLLLELLVLTLSSFGYTEVLTAESGPQALQLIDSLDDSDAQEGEGMFGCILLDIQMPHMDGIELCRQIRSKPAYSRIPIIMITAMSDRSFVDRAFRAGATDYVTKPFETLELESRIRLANILVGEQKKSRETFFSQAVPERKGAARYQMGFDQAITIEGVPNVVDGMIMENYLIQSSKQRPIKCLAAGFKFVQAERAFDLLGANKFYQLLAEIAGGIAYSLRDSECMLSYFGSGIFVCVMNKADAEVLGRAERSLPLVMKDLELWIDGASPIVRMTQPRVRSLASSANTQSLIVETIRSASRLGGFRDRLEVTARRSTMTGLGYNLLNRFST